MTNTKNVLIANRYSDALVQIAKDGKLTYEKIADDLNLIKSTLDKSSDLNEFLINPLVSVDDKKDIIDKVFAEEIDVLIVNFLKVLVDKNRFFTFKEVLNSYNKTLDKINNIKRIDIISAIPIKKEEQDKLKEKLENKLKANILLNLQTDETIIGGLVIKMGDNVIDMSLKHKLDDLSKTITR